ncbi:MAG: beta-lactamase family protein [Opitutaceae bacterium]|nr:beta-lactamase family protein [Opitutaceae bacterium]
MLSPRLSVLVLLASGIIRPGLLTATPAYDFAPLTAIVQEASADLDLRGASLRVLIDGQPVYERFFGTYTANTLVPIASASKTLSAAVLMALVDDGSLSLDDKVSKFIPSFNKPGYADITLRQCFSHTSGLPGSEENEALSDSSITLAQSADLIAQIPLIGPPGGQFAYGGLSMQVAGRCAEVATGKSWDQLFQEKITGPLGLTRVDYTTASLLPPYRPNTNPRIAGGARCNLGDYSIFAQMLVNRGIYNGRRVLSEASVREMQRNHVAGLPVINSPAVGPTRYGLGMWVDVIDANGQTVEASAAGAFGFTSWIDHARRIAAVFLVLDQGPIVRPYANRMQAALRTIVDSAAASPEDAAARLANLSVRGTAGLGDASLIAGFSLGEGDRTILVRGIGPALTSFGVTNALADPALTLFRGSIAIAANDNWATLDGRAVGAFPLTAGSRDAVLTAPLTPGGYTAVITPVSPATAGEALAELYDSGGGSGRLTNLSARVRLAAGGRLIAGFVVQGPPGALKPFLLRAVGPSLAPLGLSDVLADPKLELYNAASTLVAANDTWAGTAALASAFTRVGAFPFAAPTSKDAACVVGLVPGSYTVHLSGGNASAGTTLVEIYELPASFR